ncbi:MAG: PBP1A family penicillin-binding protein [bacterium]|nr:PBP1A family penicillin-binding protein [bacterium]
MRWRRWVGGLLLLVSLGGGFALGRKVRDLDRTVVARFEGRLFRVPSRVLSAPTILYPGLDWKRVGLRGTLERLGYREIGRDASIPVGRFHWGARGVRLHRRSFDHPSRAEPARLVKVRFAGSTIEELRDARTGRELGALFLEPELVGAYYGPDHEQRDLVHAGDVPQHLIEAVLAVEDQRFYRHPGIDVRRIAGALVANLRAGGITQGGSTLTQQLVKNFFLTPARSYERKAQEAVMALLLEARYDKPAILEAYLNEIYLGQRGSTAIHGVGEASRLYFGKSVRHLELHESALIAAIIQSPNGLSPHRQVEGATRRRDLVLRLMLNQGRIEGGAYQLAVSRPLKVAMVTPEPREARFFLDALRRQLPEFYGANTLTTEGLEIYSSLDLRLQRAATQAVREGLAELEKNHPALTSGPDELQACLVALRPQTGEVVAMVGGRSYADSQFDRCTQARRPAGSVFKPFVYVAALEPVGGAPHITLASQLSDAPLSVPTISGPWEPQNFDRKFHGTVPVRTAIERSFNVAAARLGQEVGVARISEVAHRLGIESPLPSVPSLAIGAADVSPLEMARAYATLANRGVRPEIRTFEDVVDPRGGTVERQEIRFERVLDAGTAFLATSLMQGVVDRGTARALRRAGIKGPVAGKTGTSDDEHDGWFVGFTPELVVAVWVGFDQPKSMGLASSRVAVPIWARFVREATGGTIRGRFVPPGDVTRIDVDPQSGARALNGCPQREPEYFLRGTEPSRTCPEWARTQPDDDRRRARRSQSPRTVIERLFERWLDRL